MEDESFLSSDILTEFDAFDTIMDLEMMTEDVMGEYMFGS